MSQVLTHYKRLANTDYLGAYSLYDNEGKAFDLVISIKSIARKEVKGQDGKKDMCMVAEIHGQKPFVLNATNQKMLRKLTGSPFIENWINKPFTIYATTTKVAGEVTDCLRIRPELPNVSLPELTPSHPRWAGALQAMKDGNTSIADIKKSFTLSEANENLLVDAGINNL